MDGLVRGDRLVSGLVGQIPGAAQGILFLFETEGEKYLVVDGVVEVAFNPSVADVMDQALAIALPILSGQVCWWGLDYIDGCVWGFAATPEGDCADEEGEKGEGGVGEDVERLPLTFLWVLDPLVEGEDYAENGNTCKSVSGVGKEPFPCQLF